MTTLTNQAADNRRRRLRQWIDERFGGSHSAFIASTNDGEKQINQGELSGLLRNKSFGEKRARRLEEQAKMPAFYLERPDDPSHVAMEPAHQNHEDRPPTTWPFTRVTLKRLADLKKSLGGHRGVEAMHDIDETLELVLMKWERRAAQGKSQP